jgi:hypothetical protein
MGKRETQQLRCIPGAVITVEWQGLRGGGVWPCESEAHARRLVRYLREESGGDQLEVHAWLASTGIELQL